MTTVTTHAYRIAPSILAADLAGSAIFGQPDYKSVIDAMRTQLAAPTLKQAA